MATRLAAGRANGQISTATAMMISKAVARTVAFENSSLRLHPDAYRCHWQILKADISYGFEELSMVFRTPHKSGGTRLTAARNKLCGSSLALSHIVSREADGKDAPDSRHITGTKAPAIQFDVLPSCRQSKSKTASIIGALRKW
jgi:hypothetical protein